MEGEAGGAKLIEVLVARATELGVRIVFDSGVKTLVRDGDRIVGVTYKDFDGEKSARANKGVILAAGQFGMNTAMVKEYCPHLRDDRIEKQGSTFDDGAGHQLGAAAGGVLDHMDGELLTSPFYPPQQLIFGILVNKHGKRFINEDVYHSKSSIACLDQPDGIAYLIADDSFFERPLFQWQPLIDAWETVEEMEKGLGLPDGSLQKTIADYNSYAEKGDDPEFHKTKKWMEAAREPALRRARHDGRQRELRGLPARGPARDDRRRGRARGRQRDRRPLRGRRLRVEHRAGRPGLLVGHLHRRGHLLRPPGRPEGGRGVAARPKPPRFNGGRRPADAPGMSDPLLTEAILEESKDLDRRSTREVLETIHREDQRAVDAVGSVLGDVERAVEILVLVLQGGGTWYNVGAGTSGRLGVLDASEIPPTFGYPPERVQGIIAGGEGALVRAVENAEDSAEDGRRALQQRELFVGDAVVAISSSGHTPFALGALDEASAVGARRIAISSDPDSPLARAAEVSIAPRVGPEVIAGSTRMKGGLSHKAVLHLLSTTVMVRLGRVEGNLMKNLHPASQKLRGRAVRIVMQLAEVDESTAAFALSNAKGSVEDAVAWIRASRGARR